MRNAGSVQGRRVYNPAVNKVARKKLTFEMVRRAALSLPDVDETTWHGLAGFRRAGKLFLVFREQLDSIVVRAAFERRDEMIETDPETYYTNDHYRAYPWVLARLEALDAGVLPDLLRMGWQYVQRKKR
jgi:hypothetical protein